jgi:fumarate reductase flavoprotein subunit
MKQNIIPKLLIVLFGAALTLSAGAMDFKHQAKGIKCEQCHGVASPAAPAKAKSCVKCHNYPALAEKTKALNPNPHDSHAGEVRCTLCHREHAPSVVYCKECHKNNDPKFDFKTP